MTPRSGWWCCASERGGGWHAGWKLCGLCATPDLPGMFYLLHRAAMKLAIEASKSLSNAGQEL